MANQQQRIEIYDYDPGATRHSGKSKDRESSGSKYVSVEGDEHEDPTTGSHTIYYPSQGGVS
jgi:hypothetical protein